ncbi:MAG: nucleotidyltransferase domain-containing protein [Sulfuricellaceae bacterium]
MRLTDEEHQAIRDAIRQADADAQIYLFGSRADDTEKGGDIDLMVLSQKIDLMAKLDILARLHLQLGERRIDIGVYPDATRPFTQIAIRTGVPL